MSITTTTDLPEHLEQNQRTLVAALTTGKAMVAQIEYAGSGDSGSVHNVVITPGNGAPFDDQVAIDVLVRESRYIAGQWHHTTVVQSTTLRQALEDFAEQVLDELHGGWENNDGAQGEVVFIIDKDGGAEIRVQHTSFFTESDYTETQL